MDVLHGDRPVLVGVDGSEPALRAVRWAAAEAARRQARLRVVTAYGWVDTSIERWPGPGIDRRRILVDLAEEVLDHAVGAARAVEAGVDVDRAVLTGYPVPRLSEESRAARLLVLGDRGLGGVAGLLVGSVAVGLVARSACPVVVVRGSADVPSDGPVVVGIDGTPLSEPALAFAYEAAAVRRAPLVAVHAWRDAVYDPETAPAPDREARDTEEAEVLAERLAGWGAKHPDVAVERVLVRDRPARVLVERSAGAQLVVVGSHGRDALTGLVLGSVSHALLHRAACPVAVVRADAEGAR